MVDLDEAKQELSDTVEAEAEALLKQMRCEHDGDTSEEHGALLCDECGSFIKYTDDDLNEWL